MERADAEPQWKLNLRRQIAERDVDAVQEEYHVSFTIHLLSVKVAGRHVSARFYMPRGYPEDEPLHVSVICSGQISRLDHDAINMVAREEACKLVGHEGGFQILQVIQEKAEDLNNRMRHNTHNQEKQRREEIDMSICIKRVLIWFHHIKSPQKRKSILEWSKSHDIGGYLKSGYPGILVIEGEKSWIDAYVKQVQCLRWQAMSVRAEEEKEVPSSSTLESSRRFPIVVKELEDHGGMSELGRYCKEANLEGLFLSALKITR
ncbi:RWD domain-containing protein 2A isoform X2 [Amborella trichopoda]|uniref:RWD domain-containing protein 2A isoform X2 n=1 Tax=Amborella trichopoda TaxID=13333 RepID=UPI0009C18E66|nr:RWD domain-containing protein 2A isoform X2 [Amborella trichopoda]|eukprot:XP_020519812.1 RWD domain-containing protein 2A isoform X2 [Amborella trichopoda]